jgi:hypothetical protein
MIENLTRPLAALSQLFITIRKAKKVDEEENFTINLSGRILLDNTCILN